jgi:carboxymethylenebutenolidase
MTPTSNGTPSCIAYITGPEDSDRAAILLHDFFGVKDYNTQWADRLAELGFRSAVVDLYGGRTTSDREQAGQWMKQLDQDEADQELHKAARYLAEPGRKLLAMGWSFGGRQAMRLALLEPDFVIATIVYYGRTVNDVAELKRLGGPVQVVYATEERAWPRNKEDFETVMNEAGQRVDARVFEAGHGFANPESHHYRADIVEQAWEANREFLRQVFI